MHRIRLIHWNVAEAEEKAAQLRAMNYQVDCEPPQGLAFLREAKEHPWDAIVIDLGRLPTQGRDIALAIRQYKSTRFLPLIFVGGEKEKVERVKKHLPDAVYADWSRVDEAIENAIAHPPTAPFVPTSNLAGYSGTPLVKKLGIKANMVIVLINASEGFANELVDLPAGVTFVQQLSNECGLVIWFVYSSKELDEGIGSTVAALKDAKLWIAWPKRASGMRTDLAQQYVREIGLANGLVDYKVCAINEFWSGLLFARRKAK